MEPKKTPPPAPSDAPEGRPRKRWKKILLIAGGSLAGLVLLAVLLVPSIVSSVAKSKIPEVLGPLLDADVTVGDVSFGWSGRLAIDDLKIVPKGFPSPLFEVKKVDAKVSLGSAIGGKYIAEVEVVAPKIVVEKNAQGRFNYDFPPRPSATGDGKEKGASGSAEQPFVLAVLQVREGEVTVKGGAKDTVIKAVTVDAKVDTLGKPVDYALSLKDPQEGSIRVEGSFDLEKKAGPVKVTLERLALDNFTGAARAGDLKLAGAVKPVELSKWIPDLGLGGPPIELSTAVSLKPDLITVTGKTELKGLLIRDAGTGATRIAMTKPVECSVEMKGKDRDIVAKLKTAFFEWVDQGYAAKGALESDVTVTSKGTTGTTKILNLEIVDDRKNKGVEPAVTLVHDVGMSPGAYDLRKVEIASGFLRGSLTGGVRGLDQAPEFVKVRGTFRYHPDRLGAALKPWLPGTLAGAEEKTLDLSLDGKVMAMDALSILRGSTSTVDLDLAKFTMTGTTLSGKTRLDLKGGRMVSGTPLEVNQGKTELNASIDFREKEQKPRSTVVFQSKDVDANANMGPLLENINPIFHTVRGILEPP